MKKEKFLFKILSLGLKGLRILSRPPVGPVEVQDPVSQDLPPWDLSVWQDTLAKVSTNREYIQLVLSKPTPAKPGYRKIARLQEVVRAWNVETSSHPKALFCVEGNYPLERHVLPIGAPPLPPHYIAAILIYCNPQDPPARLRRSDWAKLNHNMNRAFAKPDVLFVGRARWLWDEDEEDIIGFRLRTAMWVCGEEGSHVNNPKDFRWAQKKLEWLWRQAFPDAPGPEIVPGKTLEEENAEARERKLLRAIRKSPQKVIDPYTLCRRFSDHFEMYGDDIQLPLTSVERRQAGEIHHPNWHIRFSFSNDPEYGEYMEYSATWKPAQRTTNWRIYASGHSQMLPPYICETCGIPLLVGQSMCSECAFDKFFARHLALNK